MPELYGLFFGLIDIIKIIDRFTISSKSNIKEISLWKHAEMAKKIVTQIRA